MAAPQTSSSYTGLRRTYTAGGQWYLSVVSRRGQLMLPCATLFLLLHADTPVNLQVRLENLGNTILKGVVLAIPQVANLTCRMGAAGTADADILSTGTSVAAAVDVAPKTNIVCTGSFTFDQAELDIDRASRSFAPALTTTSTGVEQVTTGYVDGYATLVTVPIRSVPTLTVSVDATACVKPAIIPADATSE
jgi:hypothetical protein